MLRPSLCPHHAMVFAVARPVLPGPAAAGRRAGPMFRAERSGVLSGLSRVRAISLNDAHNFCALDQVGDEVAGVLAMMARAHAALGFAPSRFRLSLRGDGAYLGDAADWDLAEELLREALDRRRGAVCGGTRRGGLLRPEDRRADHRRRPGGSRAWPPCRWTSTSRRGSICPMWTATAQRRRPVMVHRSLVGSMERLFAHLIEVHEGAFPAWYAPVQVVVLPVGEAQADAADAVRPALRGGRAAGGGRGRRARWAPGSASRAAGAVRGGDRCPRGRGGRGVASPPRRAGVGATAGQRGVGAAACRLRPVRAWASSGRATSRVPRRLRPERRLDQPGARGSSPEGWPQ